MASVTVCGSASRSVTPDRAVVCLGIDHLAPDAAGALDQVARRAALLEEMLSDHGLDRPDWVTEGVQVSEEWQWKNDTNVLVGHRARTAVSVTVRTLDLVGTLIRDGVTTCGANVRGLDWRVDADNPARAALLGEAARDARSRAMAYAEALGLRLGEVELVSETPIAGGPGPQPVPMAMAMESFRAAKAGDEGMSVSGGVVELHSEVHVRFGTLS